MRATSAIAHWDFAASEGYTKEGETVKTVENNQLNKEEKKRKELSIIDGKGKSYQRREWPTAPHAGEGKLHRLWHRKSGVSSAPPQSKWLFPHLRKGVEGTDLTAPFCCCLHETQSDKHAGVRNPFRRPVNTLLKLTEVLSGGNGQRC